MEKIATENTRLIYMTTELLLQKLVQDKCLTEYTHIFVDEVHKRLITLYIVCDFCCIMCEFILSLLLQGHI